ncbi:hypothetical protein AB4254_11460 [Vibrio breoganii]
MYRHSALVLTGRSASGKDHLKNEILRHYKSLLPARSVISTTTRPIRESLGERNHVDYYFIDTEEFERRIEDKAFIEFESFNSCYYGTEFAPVKKIIDDRAMPIFIVEPKGHVSICNYLHEQGIATKSVFIDADKDVIAKRLIERCQSAFKAGNDEEFAAGLSRLHRSYVSESNWGLAVNYDDSINTGETLISLSEAIVQIALSEANMHNKTLNPSALKHIELPKREFMRFARNVLMVSSPDECVESINAYVSSARDFDLELG